MLAGVALSMLPGCSNDEDTVTISGVVNEGKGELLALMHLSGQNPVLLDTLRLGDNGSFKFKTTVEKGGPDFFCLVCNGQTIPFISDTLQTPIVINTEKDNFSTAYTVGDSLNSTLRRAVNMGSQMRRSVLNLTRAVQEGKMPQVEYAAQLETVISDYKANVLHDYIYQDPASPVSYYLLFETVSGLSIFNPLDQQDNRAYGAVANLWLNTYPNSPRTAFLEQRTREGMALRTRQRLESERADSLVQNAINQSSSYLDLKLQGTDAPEVALSSVAGQGKVTLLDFTAYYLSEASIPHNEELSRVWKKYQDRGINIYQVCLDGDINFWKVSASHLPWTVVRDTETLYDENGMVAYSAAAALYNVQQIPTTFVMGRDGAVLQRVEDDSTLDAAIARAL